VPEEAGEAYSAAISRRMQSSGNSQEARLALLERRMLGCYLPVPQQLSFDEHSEGDCKLAVSYLQISPSL